MTAYMRLMNYIRPYLGRLLSAIVCIILAASGNLYVPWIIRDVIDKVLMTKDMAMLNTIAIGIVVIFFLRGIFFYGQTYLMSFIGQKVIIDIREAVYRHIQRLSLSYYEKRQTGTIMSYITNDVAAVQGALVDSVIEMVTEGMTLLGSMAFMFYLDWKLSLLTFITLPLVAQTIKIFGKRLRQASSIMQTAKLF
jgi:subfamily B ATP-binding cassette protein MsbA